MVVVSLALLSTVLFVGKNNMGPNILSRMIGRDYMMDGVGGGYDRGYMGEPVLYETGVTQVAPMPAVMDKMAVDSTGMEIMPPYYDDDALDVENRSYEQYANHSVVVDDVNTYLRGLKEYFLSINGVVLNSSLSSMDKFQSGSLYVKVPVEKFDEATGRVTENVKKVVDESVSAMDITGQVVNTTETVVALQEQKALKEAQLKDAKTEVEKTRIQIEIDRLARQITTAQKAQESVESRTEYASLSITAADSERYFNPGSTGDFRYELERAWESLKSFVKVLFVFGIWLAVYSVIWAPIIWIASKVMGKLRSR